VKSGGALLVLSLLATFGCTNSENAGPISDARSTSDGERPLLAPTRAGFETVANAMQPRCGTLDCHGQIGRNLRLFGSRGLRLLAKDNPADNVTSVEEYDATYWSVIALEPEIITQVVRDGGQRPERLTLIRKARGVDEHKGGTLMKPGDDLDNCLLIWLAGNVADSFCRKAAAFTRPGAATDAMP
jgi:hypothetical protein